MQACHRSRGESTRLQHRHRDTLPWLPVLVAPFPSVDEAKHSNQRLASLKGAVVPPKMD